MSSPKELLRGRLAEAFCLYADLVAGLPDGALSLDLAGVRSNRIGQQLLQL